MDVTLFSVEEENLICVYDTSSRTTLISEITDALPNFDEPKMCEIAQSTLNKLNILTDADFAALTFYPAYHGDEDDFDTGEV